MEKQGKSDWEYIDMCEGQTLGADGVVASGLTSMRSREESGELRIPTSFIKKY